MDNQLYNIYIIVIKEFKKKKITVFYELNISKSLITTNRSKLNEIFENYF